MFTLRSPSFTKIVLICSVVICTNATAFDASVCNFVWGYPQTLTPDTSQVQYSFQFQLGPFSYPVDCYYTTQLYLSRDRFFSCDDFALSGPMDTLLPARATGFSSTVTRSILNNTLLPESGTYYIFLEISPGPVAPPDTNGSNNTAMASGPVTVENGAISPPPSEPELTAATVIINPLTGQSIVVAGYSDGVLEFRDWQGNVIATREGFNEITALATGIVGDPPLLRLFEASTDSGGTLCAIDPIDIDHDLASHTNLGRISAIEVSSSDDAVYVGNSNIAGRLRKLNALTLATEDVRGNLGQISDMTLVRSICGNVLAVGSNASGGSVSFLNTDTLNDVTIRRQNLGFIYALASADMDQDEQDELVIASSSDDGSIRLREGPFFNSDLAVRTGLGEIYALDYGSLGDKEFACILFASADNGGSLNVMAVNAECPHVTIEPWADLHRLGPIYYAELHDFYMMDSPFVGAIWQEDAGPVLHVLDENLIESGVEPVSYDDFETGDFGVFPWGHSGNAFWTITGQEKNSGMFSAKAGAIGHDNRSILYVRLPCISGNISFYRKVSCEQHFDYLRFAIDGVEQGRWSGEVDWAEVSFPVTAGTRTFEWTYSKDSTVYLGNDTAWIDDIVFPVGNAYSSTGTSGEQPPCRIDVQYEFNN